jgi:hypothetical protein
VRFVYEALLGFGRLLLKLDTWTSCYYILVGVRQMIAEDTKYANAL